MDHSEISARRTYWIQPVWLNSVGGAQPPIRSSSVNITNPDMDCIKLEIATFKFRVKDWLVTLLFTHKHMVKLLHTLNLNYYVLSPTYARSCQILFWSGFKFLIAQDLVSEGAKHLFSLCEKRHFTPVRNRLRLIRTVRLHTVSEDKRIIFFTKYFLLN